MKKNLHYWLCDIKCRVFKLYSDKYCSQGALKLTLYLNVTESQVRSLLWGGRYVLGGCGLEGFSYSESWILFPSWPLHWDWRWCRVLVSSWFSLHVGDWWRLRRRSNIYRKVAGLASLEFGVWWVYSLQLRCRNNRRRDLACFIDHPETIPEPTS